MKNVVIGNSTFARLLAEYLEEDGIPVYAFSVDAEYMKENEMMNKPILSLEELSEYYDRENTRLYLGIGYSRLGEVKKTVYRKYRVAGFSFSNYIHPTAYINSDVVLGKANIIFENVTIQRHTVIGEGNLFFSNCVVMHDTNIGDFNSFGACSVINGYAKVKDCSFVGSNSTIRNRISINRNTLVGAAAYVDCDTFEDCVVRPAKSEMQRGGIILSAKI